MRRIVLTAATALCALCAQASWYWPFGSDDDEPEGPRLSELMEPATTNIDAAADFAAEGKLKEAQDCYRAAIAALKKIESENPERAATPEFATVRNKRAYINAALDAMLLAEARDNAKAVSVTDTTELEVKMTLKPWKEFLPTYEALTNADRLVTKRLAFVESKWARELLDSVSDARHGAVVISNCNEIGLSAALYADRKDELTKAYRTAATAVARLEKFADTASTPGGMRVFSVCKKDARKGISACRKAWPKCGEALDKLNANLEGLRGVMLEVGAKRDFPEIAKRYAEEVMGRSVSDAQAMAEDLGHLSACQTMLGEMDAVGAGVVHRGVLYNLHVAWGGEEADVPVKEDDKGLVKDEGDKRPEVESQIDEYMEKERKHNERVQKVATAAKAKKGVQKEIKKLLKEDPTSRRARLLQAGEDLRNGNYAEAKEKLRALLDEKPNDGPALNMRSAVEAAEGDLKAAEKTLDQAIQSNPRDYHAYYNMASVYLQKGNVDSARRYYETGRAFAGPKNEELEKAVMHK